MIFIFLPNPFPPLKNPNLQAPSFIFFFSSIFINISCKILNTIIAFETEWIHIYWEGINWCTSLSLVHAGNSWVAKTQGLFDWFTKKWILSIPWSPVFPCHPGRGSTKSLPVCSQIHLNMLLRISCLKR